MKKLFLALGILGVLLSSAYAQAPSPGASGPASGTGYPPGSMAATGVSTGTTGAVVATLAASPGRLTYICGFQVSAAGTATVSPIVVAGTQGGSITYQGITAGGAPFQPPSYTPCIPASAQNTAITVTTTADGTATAVDVNVWGYQQ